MSSQLYILKTLLWNNAGGHDKIWGWVETFTGNKFCFWGRREVVDKNGLTRSGKRPSLQFKKHDSGLVLYDIAHTKMKKGYIKIDPEIVDKLVPGFTEFFDYALVTARMTGKVRTDDWD